MNLCSAGCKFLTVCAVLLAGLLSSPICHADIVVGESSSKTEPASNVAVCLDTLDFDAFPHSIEEKYPVLDSGTMLNSQFLGSTNQPFESYDRGTTVPEPDNFVLVASLILTGLFFLLNHRFVNRTRTLG